ncbi:basic helix-loop-helix protein [Coemansia sp. RSA 2320]|nr:basic helix-loop-helix protein [Coemansia sp. RSA 2320]
MNEASPNSNSSVLLTVEERGPSTRSSLYTSIAPRNATTSSGASAATAASGLAQIAPAAESRADGTSMVGGSPSLSNDRSGSGASGSGGAAAAAANKRRGAATAATGSANSEGSAEPGSDEWLRLRRLAHKEVEQRRRDVINNGIDRLAELVPGAERHRGRIVNQAVDYIHRLKEAEAQNIEKWTIEKLLADQVISGLTNQLEQAKKETKKLKRKIKTLTGANGDDAQMTDSPVDDDEDEADEAQAADESMASAVAAAAAAIASDAAATGQKAADDDEQEEEETAAVAADSKPKSKPTKRRKR